MTTETILITGGTGRIGAVLVRALAESGHRVVFTSRTPEKRDRLLSDIARPEQVVGLISALDEPDAVEKLLAELTAQQLLPGVLINNARRQDTLQLAGNGLPGRTQWLDEYVLDVVAPCALAVQLAAVKKTPLKSVINIASMYGVVPFNSTLYEDPATQAPIHYSVAKAAQIHMSRELAVRLAGQGIRVNSIAYGGVEGRVDEAFKKRYARLCPQGRMLTDKDLAGPVAFLLSEASAGVTGHNLVVDGGWTVW
ncbi:MAG: SDR family oxidoreductase [Candidatus Melainabacteria bacterium]